MEHWKTRQHLIHDPEVCPTCLAIVMAMNDEQPPTQVSHDGEQFNDFGGTAVADYDDDGYPVEPIADARTDPKSLAEMLADDILFCMSDVPCHCKRIHYYRSEWVNASGAA